MNTNDQTNIDNQLTLNERTTLLLDYWKQTSNVQQHFNDVSMKLRNFAVVVFSGFLTGVGLAIHKNISINIFQYEVSAGVLFALAGMIATQLIHFMDTYWYHVFLKGAVVTSSSIEQEIKRILGVKELSDGISSSSQAVSVASVFGIIHLPISWKEWLKYTCVIKSVNVDSTKRHKIFYRWLLVIFVATGIGSIFTHPPKEAVPVGNATIEPVNIFIHNNEIIEKDTSEATSATSGFIISGSNVRVRNMPNFDSEITTLLPVGKIVTIENQNNKISWVKVIYKSETGDSESGWVHRDFLANLK
ncbi:SH3 domain-containing protein [Vibrio splendidus]|uniref:SH3 domain-containing protein n=1 Tax=Vibrio splendidus TaxID=29497 RepID=UPI001E2E1797|nr:SH3 domain-containing protein [Vibrio splendidus]MCC4863320.1 SH3 domain-containing protein [Vibrio splendidus]